jgi:hypothetical protein
MIIAISSGSEMPAASTALPFPARAPISRILEGTAPTSRSYIYLNMEATMAQKGAGGNAGAVTKKGGDHASGSTGTGRGGGGKTGNSGKKG